jgi:hypothetical protein
MRIMNDAMNDAIGVFETREDDLFTIAVSDEALEATACAGAEGSRAFTAALCTVMADCSS